MRRSGTCAPSAPTFRLAAPSPDLVDAIDQMAARLGREKDIRERVGTSARACQQNVSMYFHKRHLGDPRAPEQLSSALARMAALFDELESEPDIRKTALSSAAQALVSAQSFEAFLSTGTFGARPWPSAAWRPTAPAAALGDEAADIGAAAPAAAPSLAAYEDADWLGGMISAAHEVGRYAANRAVEGDVASVAMARRACEALLEGLAAFDFRNGPLRKAFDSVKYVVYRLEDHGLPGRPAASPAPPAGPGLAPASTAVSPQPMVDEVALAEARTAYEAADELRENCIKRCRDVQKQSKQAIFAFQRGDVAKGSAMVTQAANLAAAILMDMGDSHGWLRQSPFVHAMVEELVEARFLQAWMADASPEALLPPTDALFTRVGVHPVEYLGGLGDLIGEIGRVAVRQATNRDEGAVRNSLATALVVQELALRLGPLWPRRLEAKVGALRGAMSKMEQLLYDLKCARLQNKRPGEFAHDAAIGQLPTGPATLEGPFDEDHG